MNANFENRAVGRAIRIGRMKKPALQKSQWAALQAHLNYCRENSNYYRSILKDFPEASDWKKGFEEFARLPVTRKEDVYGNNNLFFAAPPEKWADAFATSGSSGKKVYFPYTEEDMVRMAVSAAAAYAMGGVTREDMAVLTLPMGVNLWQGGLGYYGALRAIGAATLRSGPGFHERTLELIERFPATMLCGAPSFLSSFARFMGDKAALYRGKIVKALTVGEDCLEAGDRATSFRRKLEAAWPNAKIIAGYGSTEAGLMACDCGAGRGYHYSVGHLFIEVLSMETGLPLNEEGALGELVVTPIGVKGAPLLRYATGDIVECRPGPCGCGFQAPSIGPIRGRLHNRLKVRGVSLFPDAVEEAVNRIPEIVLFQLTAFHEDAGGENLLIRYAAPALRDDAARAKAEARWTETFRAQFGVAFPFEFCDPDALSSDLRPAGEVKPRKFVDRRGE